MSKNILSTTLALACIVISLVAKSSDAMASEESPVRRTYTSAQGDVDLEMLEKVISKEIDGADVRIISVRWSYNPMAYGAYFLGKALGKSFATYVVDFNVANAHNVQCRLSLFLEIEEAMVSQCSSDTANVSDFGFVTPFQKIGLPQKPPIGNSY